MPEISKTMCIEMGHRLQYHEGKCRNLHGHSYKIEVFIAGPISLDGPTTGMVIDFSLLKQAMATIDKDFDHKMCLQFSDPILNKLISTMEEKHIQDKIHSILSFKDYLLLDCGDKPEDLQQQYVIMSHPPTAEVLAIIWLNIIKEFFGTLDFKPEFRIKVWETATSCVEAG